MTAEQTHKLKAAYDHLSENEKKLDYHIIHLTTELKSILLPKEVIRIDVGSKLENNALMIGYKGVINVLQVRGNEVILKPNLISQLLEV